MWHPCVCTRSHRSPFWIPPWTRRLRIQSTSRHDARWANGSGIIAFGARPASAQEIWFLKGLSSATISFGGDEANASADARQGIVGGKYLSHAVLGRLALELDALIAIKGTEFDFGQGDAGTAKLTYLGVPLLARVNFAVSDAARVHLIAGPSFNFKLSGTFDREGSAADDRVRTYETALVVGGGVTLNRLRIDARYD